MSTLVAFTESLPVASSHQAAPGHKAALLRDAVTPTATLVADDYCEVTARHSCGLYVDFADVDAPLTVALEVSPDKTNWYSLMEDDPDVAGESIPWQRVLTPNDIDTSSTPWTGGAMFPVALAAGINFIRTKTKRNSGSDTGTVSVMLVAGVTI